VTTVHLIGGGPGAVLATRRHLAAAVAATGVAKPLVAYVGVASDDHVGFQKLIAAAFAGSGARVQPVKLAKQTAKVSVARQLLADADLVFLSGGDVEHGMNLLDERGVADDLRRLAGAGKPFCGISAGAILLGRHWVRFPDDDDAKAEPFACLGIAPASLDTHSEDDGWSELRVLLRLLARRGDAAEGYGVPSHGCLRLAPAGAAPAWTALGAPIARFAVDGEAPVERAPLDPNG
jgi:hypothetical protein